MSLHPELYPVKEGWQLTSPKSAADPRFAANPISLEEAAQRIAALPERTAGLELALPSRLAVFENFTLPTTDPEEAAGMAELQMEKRLPFSVEEMVYTYRLVSESESVTRVHAAAVPLSRLTALANPLVAGDLYPACVSIQALRVGGAVGQEAVAAVWWEEAEIVFGVFEKGFPLLIELFESTTQLCESATRLLMAASVAGASGAPKSLFVGPGLEPEGELLRAMLGVEMTAKLPRSVTPDFPNLAPAEWSVAQGRHERKQKALHGAKIAVAVVLVLIFGSFGLLKWKSYRLEAMQAQLDELRPGMEELLITQAQWNHLAPAIDEERYTVEMLHRVSALLPSEKVRITEFHHEPDRLQIKGEAPTAGEAVAFTETLKAADFLSRYTLETPPPTLLDGGKASFEVIAK